MIVKKNFLLVGLICLFFSCEQRAINSFSRKGSLLSQDTNTIYGFFNPSEYFRTREIQTDTSIHTLTFFIANSKLLYAKKRKMGKKWVSPEAWASVAATHQANYLPTNIDSLVYILQMDDNVFRYGYSVAQMEMSNRYLSTCKQFSLFLNARDYYAIKNLLGSNLTSNYNDNQISNLFKRVLEIYPSYGLN